MTITVPDFWIGFLLGIVATILFALAYTAYTEGKRK